MGKLLLFFISLILIVMLFASCNNLTDIITIQTPTEQAIQEPTGQATKELYDKSDSQPDVSVTKCLTANEAKAIYNAWLDNHVEISSYILGQSNEIYTLNGENYHLFHADEISKYWFNILVQMKTGELLC